MQIHNEKKTLYIIRHGETEFNKLNIVQGSGVDTDLNALGLAQARSFFIHYQDYPFDRIYTSALKRSQQSVQFFLDKWIPHTALKELNEISWGDFEGKPQTAEQRALYWEVVTKWNEGDVHAHIPNGESPYEMQQRQQVAVNQILSQPNDKNILICMHGRAMKSFLCLLLEKPISKMEEFPHTNLGLYKLEYDSGKFHLITGNDTTHLTQKH